MTPRSLEHLHKSTTGRIVSAGMRLLDSVAPTAAQRLAFDWFGKPRRRAGQPSIGAHRFRLTGDGPELAVWDWGRGPAALRPPVRPRRRSFGALDLRSAGASRRGARRARGVRSPEAGPVANGAHAGPPRPCRSGGPAGRCAGPRPGLAGSAIGDAR